MIASKTKTVGAYEAKTHLPALLKQVERGKEIIITRRERPIARLVPVHPPVPTQDVFEQLRSLRGTLKLKKGEKLKNFIVAGRRI